jgi:hypothetical protein
MRRKPWVDRMKDYLNPGDFLLWLSEEIETRDWDSKQLGAPLALGLHIVLLVARANSGGSGHRREDDVFGDVSSGSGWFSYIVSSGHQPFWPLTDLLYRQLSLFTYFPTSQFLTQYTLSIVKDITVYSKVPSTLLRPHPQPTECASIPLQFPLHLCGFSQAFLEILVQNLEPILTQLGTYGSLRSGIQYLFAYSFSASSVLGMSWSTGYSFLHYHQILDLV